MASLIDIADRSGVVLVEDAACAIGSEILFDGRWERLGAPHGHMACFSFHPRKILTTGEGGLITTSDPALDARCRRLRQHGRSPSGGSYTDLGYNYRMSDLHAAIGRAQLRKLDAMLERRRELAARYSELLVTLDGVIPPRQPSWARANWQSYCVRLPDGVDQQHIVVSMNAHGVTVLGGIMCAHAEPVYRTEPWTCGVPRQECGCTEGHCERLIRSEEARDRCLLLPIYHELTDGEQIQVVEALEESLSTVSAGTGEGSRA